MLQSYDPGKNSQTHKCYSPMIHTIHLFSSCGLTAVIVFVEKPTCSGNFLTKIGVVTPGMYIYNFCKLESNPLGNEWMAWVSLL